jgi:hypothetical protein
VPYLEVALRAIALFSFFVVPMTIVLVASFFDYNMTGIIRTFTLSNFIDLLTSRTTLGLYLETLKFALIVWAITLAPAWSRAPNAWSIASRLRKVSGHGREFRMGDVVFECAETLRTLEAHDCHCGRLQESRELINSGRLRAPSRATALNWLEIDRNARPFAGRSRSP